MFLVVLAVKLLFVLRVYLHHHYQDGAADVLSWVFVALSCHMYFPFQALLVSAKINRIIALLLGWQCDNEKGAAKLKAAPFKNPQSNQSKAMDPP
jgi:hypothetical protein